MKSRTVVTIILALVLILIVMAIAVLMTFVGTVKAEKYTSEQTWSQSISGVQYIKLIDLNGDDQDELFVQTKTGISILDAQGQVLFERDLSSANQITFNDLDGDGVEEVLVYSFPEVEAILTVLSNGEEVSSSAIEFLVDPARVAVIPSSSGPVVIMGDLFGQLAAVAPDGSERWWSDDLVGEPIDGMEDAIIQGTKVLVVASNSGDVIAYSAEGEILWQYGLGEEVRHLRAYDIDADGTSEIYVGGEVSSLAILDGATGAEIKLLSMGQPVSRIGEAELDGDPSTGEFYVGGKSGGVWAYTMNADKLWSGTVGEKVTAIDSFDLDKDGIEEIFIGDDSGGVAIFYGEGSQASLRSLGTRIQRMDNGKLADGRQLVVASTNSVELDSIDLQSATAVFRFVPLLVGGIISLVIIIMAWFITNMPEKPVVRMTIGDKSVEGLQARRRMLKENIADVERVKSAGEIHPDAYLARLKDLRAQLAETEAGLIKDGVGIKPETVVCPNCGGTLPLGIDKCDYCGQVVIA